MEVECIFKKLDRVLVNQDFLDVLPSSEVCHLVRQGSNHASLLVHYDANEVNVK